LVSFKSLKVREDQPRLFGVCDASQAFAVAKAASQPSRLARAVIVVSVMPFDLGRKTPTTSTRMFISAVDRDGQRNPFFVR
jgi:hypothetical protein